MVKTITIHLDEETWKEYDTIKTNAQLTWDQVVTDWFTRKSNGEF